MCPEDLDKAEAVVAAEKRTDKRAPQLCWASSCHVAAVE